MDRQPTVDDVTQAASRLGVELKPDEAEVYRRHVLEQLAAYEAVLAMPYPEQLITTSSGRDTGHAPRTDEDPRGAWRWRCDISSGAEGLLSGKTISFKDNIAVAGLPMGLGAPEFDTYVPDFDATIVTRVLDAGGRIIGKNTMSPISTRAFRPPTNPLDESRTPGGSSNGSGVAVAAGEVDISFGGDQGGSIRIPAAYTGIVGLKPTFGLVSHAGATFLAEPSIDHVGPMARTTRDVAVALQAVAGHDPLDPRSTKEIPESLDVLSALDAGVEGLRIGVLEEGFAGAEQDIADALDRALERLQARGAIVTRVSVPEHNIVNQAFLPLRTDGGRALYDANFAAFGAKGFYPGSLMRALRRFFAEDPMRVPPGSLLRHVAADLASQIFGGAVYAKAQNIRPALVGAYDRVLEDHDVLVMPTAKSFPEILATPPADPLAALDAALAQSAWPGAVNTQPFNYTGHPALATPCPTGGALPASMQIVGKHLGDALVLRVGQALESLNS